MSTGMQSSLGRRYSIDWLRIFIIFLLFPFHSARIFDFWEPNYVKNIDLSWGLSWLIVIIGYWFMPLMFWLAGASSWYALESRTGITYVKERINRLFVPLIFGTLIIVPPQGFLAKLSKPGYDQSYFQFLSSYVRNWSDLSGYFGTFTPAHLWFILYLLIFSLLGLPLLLALKKDSGRRTLAKFWSFFSNPWVYLLGFIALTATEALPAPGGKNPFYFFFLFLTGYLASADQRFARMIQETKSKALMVLIPYIPMYLVLTSKFSGLPDFSPESVLLAFVRNLALWLTLIVVLGYGEKYLNFNNKWLPYMNKAAFPIYVIHQTVLLIIGFFVVRSGFGPIPKFFEITVLSLFSCVAIYDLVIRRYRIARWLFGVKAGPAPRTLEIHKDLSL